MVELGQVPPSRPTVGLGQANNPDHSNPHVAVSNTAYDTHELTEYNSSDRPPQTKVLPRLISKK